WPAPRSARRHARSERSSTSRPSTRPSPRRAGRTIVADCDHILFAYTEKHTQEAVAKLFHGFRGLLQSDASSVYDILERGPPGLDVDELMLVGCWAHCRRCFFEAAICKYAIGVEGVTRIGAMYHQDNKLKKLPPVQRKAMRQQSVSPLIDLFFEWARDAMRLAPTRTHAARALGYALNQEQELRRVLLDGRLPMDDTRSERALRKVVVGRKNWMFYGSDTHAEAAAAWFTIIASCRLHKIDPEVYLDELVRVLP
ncbi:MAG: IS66 family transposase, partial [Polyangiaceae bacterium]|nr:IS66 family transposase [Polyangiaceae bacterium]